MPACSLSRFRFDFPPGRLMHIRLAFIVGWLGGFLLQRDKSPSISESLAVETSHLRIEIKEARSVVEDLKAAGANCEWELWSQKWLLRLNGTFDLVLAAGLVWTWIHRYPRREPIAIGNTAGSSSSDSDEPVQRPISSLTSARGASSKCRPTRPSDLKLQ